MVDARVHDYGNDFFQRARMEPTFNLAVYVAESFGDSPEWPRNRFVDRGG